MTKKKRDTWLWFFAAVAMIFLLRRSVGKTIITGLSGLDGQAEAYRDMIISPGTAYTVGSLPLHIALGRSTKDYAAVRSAYLEKFSADLTEDLFRYFDIVGYDKLSEYVAALQINGQAMTY